MGQGSLDLEWHVFLHIVARRLDVRDHSVYSFIQFTLVLGHRRHEVLELYCVKLCALYRVNFLLKVDQLMLQLGVVINIVVVLNLQLFDAVLAEDQIIRDLKDLSLKLFDGFICLAYEMVLLAFQLVDCFLKKRLQLVIFGVELGYADLEGFNFLQSRLYREDFMFKLSL